MQISGTSFSSNYSVQYRAEKSSTALTDTSDQPGSTSSRTLDFSGMTRSELRETVQYLTKTGRMSLDESGGLLGLTGYAHMLDAGTGRGLTASEYENESLNAFSILREGIDGLKSSGYSKAAEFYAATLDALQRLQGTSMDASEKSGTGGIPAGAHDQERVNAFSGVNIRA